MFSKLADPNPYPAPKTLPCPKPQILEHKHSQPERAFDARASTSSVIGCVSSSSSAA